MKHFPYPAYVQHDTEFISELPSSWRLICLKRILQEPLMYGASESAEDENPEHPRFIRITDIGDDGRLRAETFKSLPPDVAKPYLLQDGDVLFARSGATVGKSFTYFAGFGSACFAGYLIRARLDQRFYSHRYLSYCCQADFFWRHIQGSQIQATIQNVSAEKYANLILPFPSLVEQSQITTFLDRETAKIDSLIAKQEKLIELLKEKRQAVISHAVTKGLDPNVPMKPSGVEWLGDVPEHWEVVKLKHLSTKINSGKTPLGGSEVYLEDGVLFLRSQNVYDEGLRLEDAVFISEEMDAGMSGSRVQPGDILMNITGASIGRTCIVPASIQSANVNQHVCIVRLTKASQRDFTSIAMKSSATKIQIAGGQNGAAREGLNFEQLGGMVIALPHDEREQFEIVCHVNRSVAKVDVLIARAEHAIRLQQEHRTALISAAVTGKIDVRSQAQIKEAA